MSFELKDGQGTLHANDKGDNPKRPDRRGELNIGGTIYELSGWIKQGSKGPWLSLSAQVKTADAPALKKPPIAKRVDPDEDIPF